MEKSEREFQKGLIRELKARFDGCVVTKLDAGHIQGIPDLLVLWENKWATLEVKKSEKVAKSTTGKRPNQERWIERMNKMSFSSLIYPENKEEVLNDMEQSFRTQR